MSLTPAYLSVPSLRFFIPDCLLPPEILEVKEPPALPTLGY